jgi:nicotinamide-nucleotide amidase
MIMDCNFTLAVAESLTGGLLSDSFVRIPGASNIFYGSVTAYSLESKINILGTTRDLTYLDNGVSATIARQMAIGVTRNFHSDIGLSTTGYAESYTDINGHCFDQQAYISLYHPSTGYITDRYVVAPREMSRNEFRKYVVRKSTTMYHKYCNNIKNSLA